MRGSQTSPSVSLLHFHDNGIFCRKKSAVRDSHKSQIMGQRTNIFLFFFFLFVYEKNQQNLFTQLKPHTIKYFLTKSKIKSAFRSIILFNYKSDFINQGILVIYESGINYKRDYNIFENPNANI